MALEISCISNEKPALKIKCPDRGIPELAAGPRAAWQTKPRPAPRVPAVPAETPRDSRSTSRNSPAIGRKKTSPPPSCRTQKIVEGLNLVALLRPMRLQDQRGSPDETEIPAHPQHDQGRPEMHGRGA